VAICWPDVWVRLKPAPSSRDLIQVMARHMNAALGAADAAPLMEILDKHHERREWLFNLHVTLEKAVQEASEMPLRRAQARRCRRQLLNRISTNVSNQAVFDLDRDLRRKWFAFKAKDAPFDEEKQVNDLLDQVVFGKLALTAMQGFYVSQYNSTLDIRRFGTAYQLVCTAFMEFKVKTFHILGGNSVLGYQAASLYDEFGVASSGNRLAQAKQSLAAAIENGNRKKVNAAQAEAAIAIRECMAALDKFNGLTQRRGRRR
jgi:hypothetical protein